MSQIPHRLYLTEEQLPKQWFNLRAVMPEQPDPMLHPATGKPITESDLSPIFCEELARQELDGTTEFIDIPEEIQEIYKMYRPSPLIRAYALEKALDTPAKIYYKFEGNNTSGSHKPQLCHCAGILCQAARTFRCDHGNGCRSVGHCTQRGMQLFRTDL